MYLKLQDKTVLTFALSLLCSPLTTSLQLSDPAVAASYLAAPHKITTVVIDAGHGGQDPGCMGKHVVEKDIALAIALKLGSQLATAYPDLNLIFTRKTDVFIPLHQRAHIANQADADLFISVHCNAVDRRNTAYGTEVFIMGLHRAKDNLDVAKRENSVILMEDDYQENYDGYDPNSPEGHIILSMYQNAYLEQSIALAHGIEEQLKNNVKRHSRGVKQAGFLVLRNTTMPSVLVEAGFLSHDEEEAYLAEPKGQREIALSIFRAFEDYKITYEGTTQVIPRESESPLIKDTLEYFVQLAASSKPLSTNGLKWKKCASLRTKHENNYYKYLAGPFDTLKEATREQSVLRDAGFKGAFVVVYQNDKRIPVSSVLATSRN